MNIETAIRYAAKGDVVLFLGAGFSFGANNIEKAAFSSGKHLAEKIATLAGLPTETPLTLAAEIFREQQGTDALIGIIKPAFTAATPVPQTHSTIASLPWRRTAMSRSAHERWDTFSTNAQNSSVVRPRPESTRNEV